MFLKKKKVFSQNKLTVSTEWYDNLKTYYFAVWIITLKLLCIFRGTGNLRSNLGKNLIFHHLCVNRTINKIKKQKPQLRKKVFQSERAPSSDQQYKPSTDTRDRKVANSMQLSPGPKSGPK